MTKGLSIEDAALKIQENLQSRLTLQNEGVINTSEKSTQNGGNQNCNMEPLSWSDKQKRLYDWDY